MMRARRSMLAAVVLLVPTTNAFLLPTPPSPGIREQVPTTSTQLQSVKSPRRPLADFYGALEVHRYASPHDIKTAYRRLVKEYHPDAGSGKYTIEKFQAIQKAYQVLSHPRLKHKYDQFRDHRMGVKTVREHAEPQSTPLEQVAFNMNGDRHTRRRSYLDDPAEMEPATDDVEIPNVDFYYDSIFNAASQDLYDYTVKDKGSADRRLKKEFYFHNYYNRPTLGDGHPSLPKQPPKLGTMDPEDEDEGPFGLPHNADAGVGGGFEQQKLDSAAVYYAMMRQQRPHTGPRAPRIRLKPNFQGNPVPPRKKRIYNPTFQKTKTKKQQKELEHPPLPEAPPLELPEEDETFDDLRQVFRFGTHETENDNVFLPGSNNGFDIDWNDKDYEFFFDENSIYDDDEPFYEDEEEEEEEEEEENNDLDPFSSEIQASAVSSKVEEKVSEDTAESKPEAKRDDNDGEPYGEKRTDRTSEIRAEVDTGAEVAEKPPEPVGETENETAEQDKVDQPTNDGEHRPFPTQNHQERIQQPKWTNSFNPQAETTEQSAEKKYGPIPTQNHERRHPHPKWTDPYEKQEETDQPKNDNDYGPLPTQNYERRSLHKPQDEAAKDEPDDSNDYGPLPTKNYQRRNPHPKWVDPYETHDGTTTGQPKDDKPDDEAHGPHPTQNHQQRNWPEKWIDPYESATPAETTAQDETTTDQPEAQPNNDDEYGPLPTQNHQRRNPFPRWSDPYETAPTETTAQDEATMNRSTNNDDEEKPLQTQNHQHRDSHPKWTDPDEIVPTETTAQDETSADQATNDEEEEPLPTQKYQRRNPHPKWTDPYEIAPTDWFERPNESSFGRQVITQTHNSRASQPAAPAIPKREVEPKAKEEQNENPSSAFVQQPNHYEPPEQQRETQSKESSSHYPFQRSSPSNYMIPGPPDFHRKKTGEETASAALQEAQTPPNESRTTGSTSPEDKHRANKAATLKPRNFIRRQTSRAYPF